MSRTVVLAAALGVFCAAHAESQSTAAPRLVVPIGHTRPVRALAVSADGKLLVSGSDDRSARVWDTRSGRELLSLGESAAPVHFVAFGPGDSSVATAGPDGTIRIWAIPQGVVVGAMQHENPTAMAFSADGRLATAGGGEIRLWDLGSRRVQRSVAAPTTAPRHVAWALRGHALIVAGPDSSVYRIDLASGAAATIRGPGSLVTALAVSEDGEVVAVAGADGALHLRSVTSGVDTLAGRLSGHTEAITSITFLDDGDVVSTSFDGTTRKWNVRTGVDQRLAMELEGATTHAAAAKGSVLAVSDDLGRIALIDVPTRRTRHLTGGGSWLLGIAASSDGMWSATSGSDNLVRVWDNSSGRLVRTLHGHTRRIRDLTFLPGDSLIASAGEDNTIRLWNVRSGRQWRILRGHSRPVTAIAVTPGGRWLVSVSVDSTARVWDIGTGRAERIIANGSALNAVLVSGAGHIITAAADGRLRGWRLQDGEAAWQSVVAHAGRGIRALALAADGRLIASATLAGDVAVRRIVDGRPDSVVARFAGASGAQLLAAMSFVGPADGPRLAVAAGPMVTLWNLDSLSGTSAEPLSAHTGEIRGVAVLHGGAMLATAGDDGTSRFWSTTPVAPTGGRLLLTRTAMDSTAWVQVAPDGRFDGSESGVHRLHFVRGLETIPLESLFERFYAPGLSAVLLGAATSRSAPAGVQLSADIRRGINAAPTVRILSPVPGPQDERLVTVAIAAIDEGGGAEDVRLYHNGVRIGGVARGLSTAGGCPADATCFGVELLFGANTLEATAFATDRTEAERERIVVTTTGMRPSTTLHVLAVGIDSYRNPAYDLNYGRADAAAFTDSLRRGGAGIYSDIVIDTLFDAMATGANITAAFARISASAKPEDAVVFYYAGHGTTAEIADSTRFYLAPHDVTQMTSPEDLAAHGISGDSLRVMFDRVPARKRLMLLDACQSGDALRSFAARGAAEERAIAQLGRSSGIFVMTATTSEQLAAEVQTIGHGVFTYALLGALSGGGIRRERTVGEVVTHARNVVPDLSLRLGQRAQYPMVWSNGMDFPLIVR